MNVSRIQFGVAAVLILAGCGDRGQFQSRTYTPAEKAKFCKTVSGKPEAYPQAVTNACADFMKMYSQGDKEGLKADTTLDPIIDSTQPAPNPNLTPGGAPGSGKPVDPKKAGDKDSKQGQGGPAAKPNTEKAVAKDFFEQLSDRDAFIKSTLQVLEMGEEGLASEIVKGIDVTVGTVSGTLVLGIDAAIVFEGKTRVLMVPAEPIAYSKDGKIKPLTATLKEFQGEDISGKLKTKVIVDAVCADEKCQNIHVRLQIAADGKVANAVAIVTLANAKYSITRNNFGAKSFGDRLAEIFPAEKVDLSKLKGADDKNGLQTTIKGIEDKKAESKADTSAKEKEAVEKAAKDAAAADKAAAEKAAAEKAAADKKASAEKSDLEERIAAAELKVVDDTKKAAPGAMKETVGKTAEAVKAATATYDSADMGPVISEASAKKAPVTYDKYQAADQRPEHGPAKISGDEARQIALKNDSPDAFYQNVPKTQTAKSVPVAPAAAPAPKAEVKRSNDEARLIESLKNHGVEAHYQGVPQASAAAVAEQDSLKEASKGVVEKTSAKAEDDSSMWSKVNTFADTWLNF